MITTIEELYNCQDDLKYISPDDMAQIYSFLSHANLNILRPTNNDSISFSKYKKYQIKIGEYVLSKSNSGHCRLTKEGTKIQSAPHGAEDTFVKTIWLKVLENKRIQMMSANMEYGLVFSGGGANGAYEIGVWKALEELGYSSKISGISGASVGSLNAVLFAQGDLEIAYKTWMELKQEDLLSFKPINYDIIKGSKVSNSPNGIVTAYIDLIANTQSEYRLPIGHELEKLINKSIYDWSFTDSKLVYACVKLRGYVNNQKMLMPVYIPLIGMTTEEIKEYLIASASIPIFYRKKRINHLSFVDGGSKKGDNVPITPLQNAGFKKIIVVDLSSKSKAPIHEKTLTIYTIGPSVPLWDNNWEKLKETIHVSTKKNEALIRLGYKDTMNYFSSFA